MTKQLPCPWLSKISVCVVFQSGSVILVGWSCAHLLAKQGGVFCHLVDGVSAAIRGLILTPSVTDTRRLSPPDVLMLFVDCSYTQLQRIAANMLFDYSWHFW